MERVAVSAAGWACSYWRPGPACRSGVVVPTLQAVGAGFGGFPAFWKRFSVCRAAPGRVSCDASHRRRRHCRHCPSCYAGTSSARSDHCTSGGSMYPSRRHPCSRPTSAVRHPPAAAAAAAAAAAQPPHRATPPPPPTHPLRRPACLPPLRLPSLPLPPNTRHADSFDRTPQRARRRLLRVRLVLCGVHLWYGRVACAALLLLLRAAAR